MDNMTFEEAKKNYIQYKEEARALAAQLEENVFAALDKTDLM